MATQDRSRQQSSYMPSQAGQQGGGRDEAMQQGRESQGRDERSLAPRQGTYLGGQHEPSPFAIMRRLSDDMDRIFENFGMGGMLSRGWPAGGSRGASPQAVVFWTPDIEMYEEQGKLVVAAELPGMRKDDVQVQVEQDTIEISGERRRESSHDEAGRYVSERSYGAFHRVIRLPEGVDAESASATFRDGLLRIEMPFSRRSRARRLEIGEGEASQSQARPQGASNSAQPNARADDGAPTG